LYIIRKVCSVTLTLQICSLSLYYFEGVDLSFFQRERSENKEEILFPFDNLNFFETGNLNSEALIDLVMIIQLES